MNDRRLPPWFRYENLASLERLIEAGLVESYSVEPGADVGTAVLSKAVLKLLRAGRSIGRDPKFADFWARGDVIGLRRWVESEAAALPDE